METENTSENPKVVYIPEWMQELKIKYQEWVELRSKYEWLKGARQHSFNGDFFERRKKLMCDGLAELADKLPEVIGLSSNDLNRFYLIPRTSEEFQIPEGACDKYLPDSPEFIGVDNLKENRENLLEGGSILCPLMCSLRGDSFYTSGLDRGDDSQELWFIESILNAASLNLMSGDDKQAIETIRSQIMLIGDERDRERPVLEKEYGQSIEGTAIEMTDLMLNHGVTLPKWIQGEHSWGSYALNSRWANRYWYSTRQGRLFRVPEIRKSPGDALTEVFAFAGNRRYWREKTPNPVLLLFKKDATCKDWLEQMRWDPSASIVGKMFKEFSDNVERWITTSDKHLPYFSHLHGVTYSFI